MTHPTIGSADDVWLAIITANSGSGADGVAPGPDVAQTGAKLGIRQVNRAVARNSSRVLHLPVQKIEMQIFRKRSGP